MRAILRYLMRFLRYGLRRVPDMASDDPQMTLQMTLPDWSSDDPPDPIIPDLRNLWSRIGSFLTLY